MEITEGFYKYQEDIQTLLHAPNFVLNRDYELRKEINYLNRKLHYIDSTNNNPLIIDRNKLELAKDTDFVLIEDNEL